MLISATSALVLNWTSKDIWKSKNAREYFEALDLIEGKALLNEFDELERYMHTQSVTNRKYFVIKHTIEFLKNCQHNDKKAQVIILAAGIAPLSVEIASLFPKSIVFDIDKYSMMEKEKQLNNICPNIKFIEADLTDIKLLKRKLIINEWNPVIPSILIMEGITYYLLENDLKNVLTFFANNNSLLVADFVLKPECTNAKNRIFGVEVFRKIKDSVGLEFVNFYEPAYFMKLISKCGFENPKRSNMDEIQYERTGQKDPFDFEEPGWISMIKN
jgi:O-methyltransferase involved in polyketide biosynthesis